MGSDDTSRSTRDPLALVLRVIGKRSSLEKIVLLVFSILGGFYILRRSIKDHSTLFVMSEAVQLLGICMLLFKLWQKRSVSGVSLESQICTAAFLLVRSFCSFMIEQNVHTWIDVVQLLMTLCVIYFMVGPVQTRQTYQKDLDKFKAIYLLVPCLALAFFIFPTKNHWFIFRGVKFNVKMLLEMNKCGAPKVKISAARWLYCRGNQIFWAFCVYLEAVSVLPQLRMMQRAKVVESFTAHYVFLLAISRFLVCAHWVLQIMGKNAMFMAYLFNTRAGLWPTMVLGSEAVQTLILSSFCYYYVKAYSDGTGIVRIPGPGLHGMV